LVEAYVDAYSHGGSIRYSLYIKYIRNI